MIDHKWVFKAKFLPDGSLDKYKSKFVAKGFQQIERPDYKEIFRLVAKPLTIRIVLTLELSQKRLVT